MLTSPAINFRESAVFSLRIAIVFSELSVTWVERSVTSAETELACLCKPSVTPPRALALTEELSVSAVDRPMNVAADFSESFDSASKRSAMFIKSSF